MNLALYDDFERLYGDLHEELEKDKVDRSEEHILFKYLAFIHSFVKTLDQESQLGLIPVGEHISNPNQRINQQYLEQAQKRREEQGDQKSEPDSVNMFGIDFKKWEENLMEIEHENKLLQRFENDKQRKEEKNLKQEAKKKEKDELQQELVANVEESKKERHLRHEHEKAENILKKESNKERFNLIREKKREDKLKQKEEVHQEVQSTLKNIEFNEELKRKKKEEIKEKIKTFEQKVAENRTNKVIEKLATAQNEKEERVWKKAQELLEKQRKLLQERERLTKDLKLVK